MILPLLLSAAAASQPYVYALVVGNNQPLDASLSPLRYADDDAARTWTFLRSYADDQQLLAVLDAETQPLFPDVVREARPPTRANVDAALSKAFSALKAQRDAGRETVFFFVFSGHGSVGEGRETRLHLLDGPFTRTDLFRSVLAPSPAAWNHVVVDACNSYFLVRKRGEGDAEAVKAFLAKEELERYPNTGVLLSTASESETHEWKRYRGGIFSHEVRSALSGAADADDDGRVTYDELAAFVAAANALIPDRAMRPQLWARAPAADVRRPIVDLAAGRFPAALRLEKSDGGRFWVEDARGVRWVDFHKAAEAPVSLVLPAPGDYFVRGEGREARFSVARGAGRQTIPYASLRFAENGALARGGAEESYRRYLFGRAYGPGFHAGFVAGAWRPEGTALNAPSEDAVAVAARGVPAAPTRLARAVVLPVNAGTFGGDVARATEESLLTGLQAAGRFEEIIGASDILAVLGHEKQKQVFGCSESADCVANIGGALDAPLAIVADLGRIGGIVQVSVKVIEVKAVPPKVLARSTKRVPSEAGIPDAMTESSREIIAMLDGTPLPAAPTTAQAPAAVPAAPVIPETPPVPRRRVWTWVAGGLGLAAVATGVFFGVRGQMDASELRRTGALHPDARLARIDEDSRNANIAYGVAGGLGTVAVVLYMAEF